MVQTRSDRRNTVTIAIEAAIVKWAQNERALKGDSFATASELENIKSDPIGFADLLKGTDAFQFVRTVLGTL